LEFEFHPKRKVVPFDLVYHYEKLVNCDDGEGWFCKFTKPSFTKPNREGIFEIKFVFGPGPVASASPLSRALGQA
jgi:hypothetical protein